MEKEWALQEREKEGGKVNRNKQTAVKVMNRSLHWDCEWNKYIGSDKWSCYTKLFYQINAKLPVTTFPLLNFEQSSNNSIWATEPRIQQYSSQALVQCLCLCLLFQKSQITWCFKLVENLPLFCNVPDL